MKLKIFGKEDDIADRIQKIILYFIRINLMIVFLGAIINSRWALSFASFLILILTFIPDFLEKRYKIDLPLEIEFVIIIFLYASLFLGEIHGYYTRFWWWDVVLHTSSGIVLGFAGFMILFMLYRQEKIMASAKWVAIFSFCFAVAIGALWEIFEFSMDQLFGFHMQRNGLVDTMWDIIVDSFGALFTSYIGYLYIKGNEKGLFNRIIKKFVKDNPNLFEKK